MLARTVLAFLYQNDPHNDLYSPRLRIEYVMTPSLPSQNLDIPFLATADRFRPSYKNQTSLSLCGVVP